MNTTSPRQRAQKFPHLRLTVLFVSLSSLILLLSYSFLVASPRKHDGPIGVFFTFHGPITSTVVPFIRSAKNYVYVSALNVDHPDVLKTLAERYAAGVDVRVITEKPVLGLPSKIDATKGLHHAKFIVTENGVLFGSSNFSLSGLETGLNDVMLFPPTYSERFKRFFLSAWEEGKITSLEGFLVSPVDRVEEYVLETIQRAYKRIWVAMYALTDQNVLATLKFKESQGVDVRVLTDKWFYRSPIYRHRPKNTKIVRGRLMHHKFVLADGVLITGSTNYTESGFGKNVEIAYSTKDRYLVARYVELFEQLWQTYGSD